jgi:hypothetical protein
MRPMPQYRLINKPFTGVDHPVTLTEARMNGRNVCSWDAAVDRGGGEAAGGRPRTVAKTVTDDGRWRARAVGFSGIIVRLPLIIHYRYDGRKLMWNGKVPLRL